MTSSSFRHAVLGLVCTRAHPIGRMVKRFDAERATLEYAESPSGEPWPRPWDGVTTVIPCPECGENFGEDTATLRAKFDALVKDEWDDTANYTLRRMS